MTSPLYSLRWRLQAWQGLILLAVIVAFCLTAFRLASNNQERRVARELIASERLLMRGLVYALEGNDATIPIARSKVLQFLQTRQVALPGDVLATFSGSEPGFRYFCIFGPGAEVLLQSDNAPAKLQLPPLSAVERNELFRDLGGRRELIKGSPNSLATLVGYDVTLDRTDLSRIAWSLAGVGLGVWILGLVGGWWLAGRAIKPVAAISATATRIAEGQLAERISIADTDSELGQLVGVLNRTFDQLQATVERQQRFTSDASHELRTPITILLSETDRILRRDRDSAEYREALEVCRLSARRMKSIVQALLTLSRQESAATRLESCDLANLAKEAIGRLQPAAEEKHLVVTTELSEAPCKGDPDALAILLDNLLRNAIEHHEGNGNVTVRTTRAEMEACLTVQDDGPGIPAEDQEHIFDRFYRVDKARTGDSGHTGLGLSIVHAIADKHGASVSLESVVGVGTTFTLRFPASAKGRIDPSALLSRQSGSSSP